MAEQTKDNTELNRTLTVPILVSMAMYFGFYMAYGTYQPFINLYFERLGLSAVQIGTLTAIPVLIITIFGMAWASLADARHWHRTILRISLLVCAGAVFLLPNADSFLAIIPFIVIYAFFITPIVPLLDSSALESVENSSHSYGELRLWGSVGWAISTVLVGILIQKYNIYWLFYCYVVLTLLTFSFSLFQPKRKHVLKTSVWSGLKDLLGKPSFLLFLLSILFAAMTLSGSSSFLSIFLDSIGTNESSIGLAWSIASLSEIPIMLFSGKIMQRIGSKGLLTVAFVTFIIRWFLMSTVTVPVFALMLQLLHGLTFAAFLTGSVTYINARTPKGLKTTAQSVFNIITFGIGSIFGSLLSGYIVEYGGMAWLFRSLSAIAALGFILFLISQRSSVEELAYR